MPKTITDYRYNISLGTLIIPLKNITSKTGIVSTIPKVYKIEATHQGYIRIKGLYTPERKMYIYPHLKVFVLPYL